MLLHVLWYENIIWFPGTFRWYSFSITWHRPMALLFEYLFLLTFVLLFDYMIKVLFWHCALISWCYYLCLHLCCYVFTLSWYYCDIVIRFPVVTDCVYLCVVIPVHYHGIILKVLFYLLLLLFVFTLVLLFRYVIMVLLWNCYLISCCYFCA